MFAGKINYEDVNMFNINKGKNHAACARSCTIRRQPTRT
jgi:hypothetical protein